MPQVLTPYCHAFLPPYKGCISTVLGMTWARAFIFWGSDAGRVVLQDAGYSPATAAVVPPLVVSTFVQIVNMPLVRSTITIQNPESTLPHVGAAMKHIWREHGLAGLWHGTSAGILKTVPKYCTAVIVKDAMEEWLAPADPCSPTYDSDRLWRSACKSATAGVAGAALTNPLDVIRNEMFKTNMGLSDTVKHLWKEMGSSFLSRGLVKNLVAVSIPVAFTIFFTDLFVNSSAQRRAQEQEER